MTQANQPKKRKTSSKKAELKIEKPTPQEKAFINGTDLPEEKPDAELDSQMEKACLLLMEMFLKKMMEFMETFGGHYSREKIMDMYGLSKNTLGDWIKNKKLPHYKVEKKLIFKISDLEDFLKKYRRVMPVFIYYFSDVVEAAAAIAA
jgi:hypothetical protein